MKTFHLNEREYYMPHQLSGGQVQRVAIARALVNSPSIILADEPTGNLDSKASHLIMEELADIHRRGNTIIMVTHNPELTSYASRVITMLDGKIDTDEHLGRKKFTKKLIADDDKEKKDKDTKHKDEDYKKKQETSKEAVNKTTKDDKENKESKHSKPETKKTEKPEKTEKSEKAEKPEKADKKKEKES